MQRKAAHRLNKHLVQLKWRYLNPITFKQLHIHFMQLIHVIILQVQPTDLRMRLRSRRGYEPNACSSQGQDEALPLSQLSEL